ncbi:MAG: hypothetical protein GY937_15235 [bacterium]|nr:hypothetical protein [bacterium]
MRASAIEGGEVESVWPVRVRVFLGLLLLPAMAFLVLGPDPFGLSFAERAEAGKTLRPKDYAGAYLFWITLVNVGVLLALIASFRHWARPGRATCGPALVSPATRWHPMFLTGTALAMLALAISAAPRLDDSLWTDEKYMVVHSIAGAYEVNDANEIEFEPVSWGNTLFFYQKPNNHVPYSILARLSWDGWRTLAQPEDRRAVETVVRMPALLFGIVGIATLAGLLARLGFPVAGVLAAWILALHPWYLRYASEVRGYSLMLALLPLLIIFGLRVLERASWPRFAVYGACQILLLWTYPGTIFVLIVINAAVLGRLWKTRTRDAGADASPLLRFAMTELLAGLVWLQLNLANMMQFLEYAKSWTSPITMKFLSKTALLMLLGTSSEEPREGFVTMAGLFESHPILLPILIAASLAAFVLGCVRLARSGVAGRLALAVLVLPGPLTIAFAAIRGDHLYEWYVIHALPGVIAGISLGVVWAGQAFPRGAARKGVIGMLALSFGASYAMASHPMRDALRTRSIEPTFELLEAFGWPPHRDPAATRSVMTGTVYGDLDYYDPAARSLRDPDGLIALMQEADETSLPLFVSFDRPQLARKRNPAAIALLERPGFFEKVGEFDGVFYKYRRAVFRYRPGSVADLSPPDVESQPRSADQG